MREEAGKLSDPTHSQKSDPEIQAAAKAGIEDWNEYQRRRRRKLALPIFLFLATCLSTFWVGATGWFPDPIQLFARGWPHLQQLLLENWQQGLIYTACVLAILLVHELGHFFATIIYRIPATAPIFLPFPFNPIGTLGAVIAMQSMIANRKQIFDIGIAGPLAGLVVAVPVSIIGIAQLDLSQPPAGQLGFECPIAFQWMIQWFGVEGYQPGEPIWLSQLNPFFAAGWVGFLITGLNMFPVGQLDGGHVTYTLFGKAAHWIADGVMVFAIAYMVFSDHYIFVVMVGLMLLIGTHHPPTADDQAKLGWFRTCLGILSLAIPILCFPPGIFVFR